MYKRIISIDWSGADREDAPVRLQVAQYDQRTGKRRIVNRKEGKRTFSSWSRNAVRHWLSERLAEDTPTLVAMDFGFGLPWGADSAILGVKGWRRMIRRLGELYSESGTARATAQAVNGLGEFKGHGPYRFDESRNDFRFYRDHGVAYYRLTELVAPQAISQWYFGSGGKVGFHTLTGLAAIDWLIGLRDRGTLGFSVWPHETLHPDGKRHLLVESYPAICPKLADYGPCRNGDQRDAWKVLDHLVTASAEGRMPKLFEISETPFGRIDGVSFQHQIQFEGYIIGLQ